MTEIDGDVVGHLSGRARQLQSVGIEGLRHEDAAAREQDVVLRPEERGRIDAVELAAAIHSSPVTYCR